jgi:hypothetical protein
MEQVNVGLRACFRQGSPRRSIRRQGQAVPPHGAATGIIALVDLFSLLEGNRGLGPLSILITATYSRYS